MTKTIITLAKKQQKFRLERFCIDAVFVIRQIFQVILMSSAKRQILPLMFKEEMSLMYNKN